MASSATTAPASNAETTTISKQDSNNLTWHNSTVSRSDREALNGHQGAVLWFTGLSGCGKSTISNAVESKLLHRNQLHTYLLDGDNVRLGLNSDLGFSADDRTENIRRIGQVAHLFADAGVIVLTAFISPYRSDRALVRAMTTQFVEIHVQASLATCEGRDPKGLYKRARAGEIKGFTGIDAPYEAPETCEVVLDSDNKTVDELSDEVVQYLVENGIIPASSSAFK